MKAKPVSKKLSLQVRPWWWAVLGVTILVAIGVLAWSASLPKVGGTTIFPHYSKSPAPNTTPATSPAKTRNPLPNPTPLPATPTPLPTNVNLAPPQGTLLNVHTAGASTLLQSTCQTLGGAMCAVQAHNASSNQTVMVKSAVTDANGSGTIAWDAAQLTNGSWEIRLVATFQGKTATSTIYETLVVQK